MVSEASSVTSSFKALAASLLHGTFSSSKSNLTMASSEFSLPFPTELQTLIPPEQDAFKEPEPPGEPEPDPNMSIHSVYMSEGGLSSTVRLVTKRPSSPDYAYKDKSALFPGSPSPVQQQAENIRPSNS